MESLNKRGDMMNNIKLLALLVLLLGVCLVGGYYYKDFFTTQTSGSQRNIVDLESSYNVDAESAQALEKMKENPGKAAIITHSNSGQRHIALTFDGLTDRAIIQQILDLLKKYNAKATFFVDGALTADDPQTVVNIKNVGQKVENYTLSGMVKMDLLPADRLVKDFCRAQKIIKVTTDQGPNLLKCNDTKYTDLVLQAAKACGFSGVVKNDVFLNVKQVNSSGNAADSFVGKIKPGSIISVKLKANVDPIINEAGKTDLKPAEDKQPGLKELPKQNVVEDKEIVDAVEKLLIALNKANYTTVYVEDFAQSNAASKATSALPQSTKGTDASDMLSLFLKPAILVQEQFKELFTCQTVYAAEAEDQDDTVAESAQEFKMIPTAEQTLSFTFGGLSRENVVDDILGRLKRLGIKGTFFVSETEMKKYPQIVRKIIGSGHEIGILIRPKDGSGVQESWELIHRSQELLKSQFGVETNLVKQPWGTISEGTKEAVAALQCVLIGQSMNVIQTKHQKYVSAAQVMEKIFPRSMISLSRGDILYFRMDFYETEQLVGDLIEQIKFLKIDNIAYAKSYDNPADNPDNDSAYTIKPVGAILNNKKFIYQYPVKEKNIPVELRTNGKDDKSGQHDLLPELSKRYIGNIDVNSDDRMLGFSPMEIRRLDQSGTINTKDNVIFITFDDWGTDASINKLLYVLRKHHVPATFFVLTNNVLYNPNLVRAIAVEGHDIGDHSDKHIPMVLVDPKTNQPYAPQRKEDYTRELAVSYKKLQDVVGDVVVNGKPVLTREFRPPTLALNDNGVQAIFANGFEYIVNGSCSTEDYAARSLEELVKTIEGGVYTKYGELNKGMILVCHMSNDAKYTAMALDILLTANESKADSDPSKFKVGRLSDYLRNGYTQLNRKKQLLQ
ncbi:MAG: polysaccharide deacetylase [Firmicutes bacterium]|nr:polysaccharide deacetylase [Bacillota bacterium]